MDFPARKRKVRTPGREQQEGDALTGHSEGVRIGGNEGGGGVCEAGVLTELGGLRDQRVGCPRVSALLWPTQITGVRLDERYWPVAASLTLNSVTQATVWPFTL